MYVNKFEEKYLKNSLNIRLQSKHSQVLTTSSTFTEQKFPTKLKSPGLAISEVHSNKLNILYESNISIQSCTSVSITDSTNNRYFLQTTLPL